MSPLTQVVTTKSAPSASGLSIKYRFFACTPSPNSSFVSSPWMLPRWVVIVSLPGFFASETCDGSGRTGFQLRPGLPSKSSNASTRVPAASAF